MRGLAIVAVAACGGGSSDSPTQAPKPASCREQADALVKLLMDAPHEMSVYEDPAVTLVARKDVPETELHDAPMVVVTPKRVRYQSEEIDPRELRTKLATDHQKILDAIAEGKVPRMSPPDPRKILYEIDRNARWGDVVVALNAGIDAGFDAPGLVFALDVVVTRPPRTPVDDKIDELRKSEGGNVATELAALVREQVKDCPSVIKVFGEVSADESGSRAENLIKHMGPGLVGCDCHVDLPQLASVMWAVLVIEKPTRVLQLDKAGHTGQATVQAPASATWAEVAKQLGPGTKTIVIGTK